MGATLCLGAMLLAGWSQQRVHVSVPSNGLYERAAGVVQNNRVVAGKVEYGTYPTKRGHIVYGCTWGGYNPSSGYAQKLEPCSTDVRRIAEGALIKAYRARD